MRRNGTYRTVVTGITDPLGRTVHFTRYDDTDRVQQQTLPDGRVIGFTYDNNGNVISITPPCRPAHGFISPDSTGAHGESER